MSIFPRGPFPISSSFTTRTRPSECTGRWSIQKSISIISQKFPWCWPPSLSYPILYSAEAATPHARLDISSLDPVVLEFCEKGLAESTTKSYKSALRRFSAFCELYGILSPFPGSEALLCHYSAYLSLQNLSPQTTCIKACLAAIRHMQITLGLPEPCQFSSLAQLQLVQKGIQCTHSMKQQTRIRQPITLAIVEHIRELWSWQSGNPVICMLWAATTLCFFSFFHSGELTVPSVQAFSADQHICCGDISFNSETDPTLMKVHFKQPNATSSEKV